MASEKMTQLRKNRSEEGCWLPAILLSLLLAFLFFWVSAHLVAVLQAAP